MELLVCATDSPPSKDPVLDAKRYNRGDVIAAKPDGSYWGENEINNPKFRLIRVSDITEDQIVSLLASEQAPSLDKQYTTLKRRSMKLNIELPDISEKIIEMKAIELDSKLSVKQRETAKLAAAIDLEITKDQLVIELKEQALSVDELATLEEVVEKGK